MEPATCVALVFSLFAASHIGLAAPTVRRPLEARLGRAGFSALFVALAAVLYSAAIATYASLQHQGAAGLGLGRSDPARTMLISAVVLGVVLMASSFAGYARSPHALGGEHVREARGLNRVTRHPFFVGLVLFGAAHALLATHLVGAVAMGGLAAMAALGSWHQDRKLLTLRGEPYAAYLAQTSTIPFAAIAAGRQRLVWRELPLAAPAIGLALAWGFREVHPHLFDHGGVYVIAGTLGGVAVILFDEWRRVLRHGARPPAPATEGTRWTG